LQPLRPTLPSSCPEVKGMIDTGVDEDAHPFIDALRGV
jgi:hypothetical protein